MVTFILFVYTLDRALKAARCRSSIRDETSLLKADDTALVSGLRSENGRYPPVLLVLFDVITE